MTFEINIKEKSLKFITSLQKHDKERLKKGYTHKNIEVNVK